MADDLELGESKKKSPSKLILIIVGGILLVLVINVAALYFSGVFSPEKESSLQQDEAIVEVVPESVGPPIYLSLDPAFIVNFLNSSDAKLFQLSISVLSFKQEVIDAIEKHKPMVRNNILLLLSAQDPVQLKKPEGKDTLRAQILEILRKLVQEREEIDGVEEVFFTTFIMQ